MHTWLTGITILSCPPPLPCIPTRRRVRTTVRPHTATIPHTTMMTTWQLCHVNTHLHFNTTTWAMWQLCHVTTLHPTTTETASDWVTSTTITVITPTGIGDKRGSRRRCVSSFWYDSFFFFYDSRNTTCHAVRCITCIILYYNTIMPNDLELIYNL